MLCADKTIIVLVVPQGTTNNPDLLIDCCIVGLLETSSCKDTSSMVYGDRRRQHLQCGKGRGGILVLLFFAVDSWSGGDGGVQQPHYQFSKTTKEIWHRMDGTSPKFDYDRLWETIVLSELDLKFSDCLEWIPVSIFRPKSGTVSWPRSSWSSWWRWRLQWKDYNRIQRYAVLVSSHDNRVLTLILLLSYSIKHSFSFFWKTCTVGPLQQHQYVNLVQDNKVQLTTHFACVLYEGTNWLWL